MTTEAPAPPDRILRECDCPEWMSRCAHHPDGIMIVLADPADIVGTKHWPCLVGNNHLIAVAIGASDERITCPRCGELNAGWWDDQVVYTYQGNDLDAALAAFHEAEERLLRGGDA